MNKLTSIIGLITIFIGLSWVMGCSQNEKEIKVITFETTLGPIVIELFEEEAPVTSKNFLDYAEKGFFNGTLFHRVIPGFEYRVEVWSRVWVIKKEILLS